MESYMFPNFNFPPENLNPTFCKEPLYIEGNPPVAFGNTDLCSISNKTSVSGKFKESISTSLKDQYSLLIFCNCFE